MASGIKELMEAEKEAARIVAKVWKSCVVIIIVVVNCCHYDIYKQNRHDEKDQIN